MIDPFGAALDQIMQGKGLTPDQVAQGTGIPAAHIRAYLTGKFRPVNPARAANLERFLGIEAGKLTAIPLPPKDYKRPF